MLLFCINLLGINMKEYIKDQIKKSYETKQAIYENDFLLTEIERVAKKMCCTL